MRRAYIILYKLSFQVERFVTPKQATLVEVGVKNTAGFCGTTQTYPPLTSHPEFYKILIDLNVSHRSYLVELLFTNENILANIFTVGSYIKIVGFHVQMEQRRD